MYVVLSCAPGDKFVFQGKKLSKNELADRVLNRYNVQVTDKKGDNPEYILSPDGRGSVSSSALKKASDWTPHLQLSDFMEQVLGVERNSPDHPTCQPESAVSASVEGKPEKKAKHSKKEPKSRKKQEQFDPADELSDTLAHLSVGELQGEKPKRKTKGNGEKPKRKGTKKKKTSSKKKKTDSVDSDGGTSESTSKKGSTRKKKESQEDTSFLDHPTLGIMAFDAQYEFHGIKALSFSGQQLCEALLKLRINCIRVSYSLGRTPSVVLIPDKVFSQFRNPKEICDYYELTDEMIERLYEKRALLIPFSAFVALLPSETKHTLLSKRSLGLSPTAAAQYEEKNKTISLHVMGQVHWYGHELDPKKVAQMLSKVGIKSNSTTMGSLILGTPPNEQYYANPSYSIFNLEQFLVTQPIESEKQISQELIKLAKGKGTSGKHEDNGASCSIEKPSSEHQFMEQDSSSKDTIDNSEVSRQPDWADTLLF